jgi:protein-L-isoaspartate(D-aspartate) O-methyltransferase
VPRHLFVPDEYRAQAYEDHPLPIGEGQTISQPYIVALMTENLALRPTDRVLEIGTGSGYQAAVLSMLAKRVFSIEINGGLARRAAETLSRLGYANVTVRPGDGFFGWKEEAPFDAIIVTCAVETLPPALLDELAEGGRLIAPVGNTQLFQTLTLVRKKAGRPMVQRLIDVRFVPMTGAAAERRRRPPARG